MIKLDEAAITILVDSDKIKIELEDNKASIRLIEIELTPKNFCAALGRLSMVPCKAEISPSFNLINKKMEVDKFEFAMPDHNLSNAQEVAREESRRLCIKGWVPDHYFNSQSSFFHKDGKEFARVTIRRWV